MEDAIEVNRNDVMEPVVSEKRSAVGLVAAVAKRAKTYAGGVDAPVATDSNAKTCFVGNVDFSLDKDSVWAAFNDWIGAGSVASVSLMTDRDTGRPKG